MQAPSVRPTPRRKGRNRSSQARNTERAHICNIKYTKCGHFLTVALRALRFPTSVEQSFLVQKHQTSLSEVVCKYKKIKFKKVN